MAQIVSVVRSPPAILAELEERSMDLFAVRSPRSNLEELERAYAQMSGA